MPLLWKICFHSFAFTFKMLHVMYCASFRNTVYKKNCTSFKNVEKRKMHYAANGIWIQNQITTCIFRFAYDDSLMFVLVNCPVTFGTL